MHASEACEADPFGSGWRMCLCNNMEPWRLSPINSHIVHLERVCDRCF